MNPDDHAVVIGIGRYGDAGAASRWITDLHGPDNDVEAVAAWLKDPEGGGVPAKNVKEIRSAEFSDSFADGSPEPNEPSVEQELRELTELPNALEERYAGRRLYVYVSGHGFATRVDEAALITAEATEGDPLHVLVTSWVEWLFTAARFKEHVLWVDCCATVARNAVVKPCDLPFRGRGGLPNPTRFYAFGAAFDERAVENEMPDKKWHGTFTYALLQGLEGAAADQSGAALRDYLHNNMKTLLRPDQLAVRDIAKEPAFGTTDPIEFGSRPVRATFDITLRFPDECIGRLATVSFGCSGAVAATVLAGSEWTISLEAGSYVAHVGDTGHTQLFTVSGVPEGGGR